MAAKNDNRHKTEHTKHDPDQPVETPFTDEELEHFRLLILEKREEANHQIELYLNQLQNEATSDEQDNAYSFHMADAGSDMMDREQMYMLIDRQRKYIGYLDRALERIDNKTYGICKVTGKPISKERLEAIPHTEISVEAKLQEKQRR
jgi:RNA polymerase-binding protein DksA